MFKIKLKRNFKFEKIRKNLTITRGTSFWNDTYEYKTITDSAFLNFAIAAAARHNSIISGYVTESHLTSDIGCLTIYGTKTDFLMIINEILEQFGDYISICQF